MARPAALSWPQLNLNRKGSRNQRERLAGIWLPAGEIPWFRYSVRPSKTAVHWAKVCVEVGVGVCVGIGVSVRVRSGVGVRVGLRVSAVEEGGGGKKRTAM